MEGWLNSGDNITYAEVFDWLMEKGCYIFIEPCRGLGRNKYMSFINSGLSFEECDTWHEAAEKAIEKVLELI